MKKIINIETSVCDEWGKTLCSIWEAKDVEHALRVFQNCTNYRESPFSDNAAEIENGVYNLWTQTLKQTKISVSSDLIAIYRQKAIYNYSANYSCDKKNYKSSGIWVAEFFDNKCISFEQWFNVIILD